jgi:ketosteroid isomerase-like protein
MSQENVEIMRRIVEAAGRQDYAAILGDLHPQVEIDDTDIPESTGEDSFLEWLARWDQVWESWHVEDLEVRAGDDDQVVALFTMVAKGKGSGLELTRPDAIVATFRDGKAARLGYYNDQAQALKAVGLVE